MILTTSPNIEDPDSAYAALIAAHKGLSENDSTALNARLVLILMNHIGDRETLDQALELARQSGRN